MCVCAPVPFWKMLRSLKRSEATQYADPWKKEQPIYIIHELNRTKPYS